MATRRTTSRRRSKGRSSRSSRTRGQSGRKPDALAMLKEDHARVKSLFDEFGKAEAGRDKRKLADTICEELTTHARLEEEIFYPAVREVIDEELLMNEAEIEHETAKDLVARIEASRPSDERFEALVTVLGEYVRHHVGEEEGEMFEQIRRSELDLAALGEEMRSRRIASAEE